MIEPGEPGEQGGRRRLPAVDQGAASQFLIFNSFRCRSHVVIQSSSGGCSTCPLPSSPTYNWRHDFWSTPSSRWLCNHSWNIIYDGRRRWQCSKLICPDLRFRLHFPHCLQSVGIVRHAGDCLNVALTEWYRVSFTIIINFPPRVVATGSALSCLRSTRLRQVMRWWWWWCDECGSADNDLWGSQVPRLPWTVTLIVTMMMLTTMLLTMMNTNGNDWWWRRQGPCLYLGLAIWCSLFDVHIHVHVSISHIVSTVFPICSHQI